MYLRRSIFRCFFTKFSARSPRKKLLSTSGFSSWDINLIKGNEVEKIFTHDSNDLNNDHILTNKAVITACRPFVRNIEIYTCEILSSTAQDLNPEKYFKPNFFVDIKDYLEKKIEAIKKYEMELR